MSSPTVERRAASEFLRLAGPVELEHFPDFLVIAPPKTGTTWLARQLGRHPGIFVPLMKETKYFNYYWRFKNLAWYLSLFQEGAGRLKGEATPNYALLPRSTIRLIHDLHPQLKLIFLMRDPVDRAWSHARWDFHLRIENFLSLGEDINEVSDDVWQERFVSPASVHFGDYLGQLQRWLEVFDRSQIFVGFTEQIHSSPRELLNAIHDFLSVGQPAQIDKASLTERVNPGESRQLSPELRDVLRRIYGGRTRQLVDFLRHEFALVPPAEWHDSLALSGADSSAAIAAGEKVPDHLCDRLAQSLSDEHLEDLLQQEERWTPHVVDSYLEWNVVEFRGRFYGVPQYLGPVDFFEGAQWDELRSNDAATTIGPRDCSLVIGDTLAAAKAQIKERDGNWRSFKRLLRKNPLVARTKCFTRWLVQRASTARSPADCHSRQNRSVQKSCQASVASVGQ